MDVLETNPPLVMRTKAELNNIKDNMSLAFMHSLNSTINYCLDENNRSYDNLGIDLTAFNFPKGKSRSMISEENEIHIQMKGVSISSTTMFTENEQSIAYTLKKKLVAIGTHYLVVVVLPSVTEIEAWRDVDEDSIKLWARAYYLLIDGYLDSGKVTIPKTNILNPETYPTLFEAAKNKDAL